MGGFYHTSELIYSNMISDKWVADALAHKSLSHLRQIRYASSGKLVVDKPVITIVRAFDFLEHPD